MMSKIGQEVVELMQTESYRHGKRAFEGYQRGESPDHSPFALSGDHNKEAWNLGWSNAECEARD